MPALRVINTPSEEEKHENAFAVKSRDIFRKHDNEEESKMQSYNTIRLPQSLKLKRQSHSRRKRIPSKSHKKSKFAPSLSSKYWHHQE